MDYSLDRFMFFYSNGSIKFTVGRYSSACSRLDLANGAGSSHPFQIWHDPATPNRISVEAVRMTCKDKFFFKKSRGQPTVVGQIRLNKARSSHMPAGSGEGRSDSAASCQIATNQLTLFFLITDLI